MIKYAWKYPEGDYYAWCSSWNFRTSTLEAAELYETVEGWNGMRAAGKPVKVEVFGELKYPWNPTRREVEDENL